MHTGAREAPIHPYIYDPDGRLASVGAGGATTTFGYDPASELTTTARPDGTTETRTWDPAGRLAEVKDTSGPTVLQDFAYTYDSAGNPTQVATPAETDTYIYDLSDRLTSACYGASCAQGSIAYTYNKVGNRLTQATPAGTTTYTYDAADELTQAAGPSGATAYTWDKAGRVLTAGATVYSWDGAGRLASRDRTRRDGPGRA